MTEDAPPRPRGAGGFPATPVTVATAGRMCFNAGMETTTQEVTMTTKAKPTTVLDSARSFIERFVAFENPAHALIISLWAIHTHAFDAAYATPYLYITSAGPECGKTRCIEATSVLARNPRAAADLTAAAMFRVIESAKPTLFVDEVDTIYSGKSNEELRSVLNSGYQYKGSVMRATPAKADDDEGGVRAFSTFSPKMLAGIDNGQVPDTIMSRTIKIELRRAKGEARDKIERFNLRKIEPQAEALRDEIRTWAAQNVEALSGAEPKPITEISDRAWDIAEPLVAIAERLGAGKEAREALTQLLSEQRSEVGPHIRILEVARDLFDKTGADRVPSAMLAEACDMNPGRMGRMLSPLGIKSTTIRGNPGTKPLKGYYRHSFVDAWDRYL